MFEPCVFGCAPNLCSTTHSVERKNKEGGITIEKF